MIDQLIKYSVWFYVACILGGFLALAFGAGGVYWTIGLVMIAVAFTELGVAGFRALKGVE